MSDIGGFYPGITRPNLNDDPDVAYFPISTGDVTLVPQDAPITPTLFGEFVNSVGFVFDAGNVFRSVSGQYFLAGPDYTDSDGNTFTAFS